MLPDKSLKEITPLRDSNLYIIFLVTLHAVMGVASITPAFPAMVRFFNISVHEIGLMIVMFTLPGIILTPVMGVLADRFGRKTILIPSLFLFGIAGFSCTYSKSFEFLLVLRFLQGIGAASLGSLNITLIGDLFSGTRRGAAMGYNASVLSIGTASYPAIGGMLAMFGWNYPFLLPLLAIPTGFVVLWGLKNPEPPHNQKLNDYLRSAWKTINRKGVWGLFIVNILIFVILYGSYLTYFPLFLESRFNAESLFIGLSMSSMSITTAIVSATLGWLMAHFTNKKLLVYGFLLYFLSLLLIPHAVSWLLVIFSVVIFGMGHGIIIPTIQTMLVNYAPIKERAAFMSVNSMVLRLGQTFGPLFIGLFYSIGGFNFAFYSGSAIALVMIVIVLVMVKK
ncbi:MAG: MFS transporter [Bacteroidales bacterium]|nr:MFS transporter [Bacteroidales bacterium]